MKLQFAKMHGAGNDFIVVDDTPARRTYSPEQIRKLCRRRTGIGADGLISLQALPDSSAVRMSFFNCDGSRASLCGNGLRCAAAFAGKYGLAEGPFIRFVTDSGILCAELLGNNQVRIELPLTEDFQEYPSLPSDEGAGIRMKGYRGVAAGCFRYRPARSRAEHPFPSSFCAWRSECGFCSGSRRIAGRKSAPHPHL